MGGIILIVVILVGRILSWAVLGFLYRLLGGLPPIGALILELIVYGSFAYMAWRVVDRLLGRSPRQPERPGQIRG